MARKFFAAVMIVALLCVFVMPASAKSGKDILKSVLNEVSKISKQNQSTQQNPTTNTTTTTNTTPQQNNVPAAAQQIEKVTWKGETDYDIALYESIEQLAQKIVENNKHAAEYKLSGKELEYWTWDETGSVEKKAKYGRNRVWAKGKTIVVATQLTNKKADNYFGAGFLVTADPNYIFAGDLHVGSKISTLESYLQSSYSNGGIDRKNGYIIITPLIDTLFGYSVSIMHDNGIITQISYCFDNNANTSKKTDEFVRSQMKTMGMKEFPSDSLYY